MNNLHNIFKNLNYYAFCIIILGFLLRFLNFDEVGFWGDEYLTYWLSEPLYNYKKIFTKTLSSADLVPPLYYYLLNLYNYVTDYSAYSLRLIHILLGTLNIILIYFISKFLLSKKGSNVVIFLISINVFLIFCSTEVRVVSFALLVQLIVIFLFFNLIKNLNTNKENLFVFLIVIFNILSLSIHPLSIVIVLSQIFFFIALYFDKNFFFKKKINFFIFWIILSCIIYVLLNFEYFLSSAKNSRLAHNQLNLNFFLGYNFKSYFSSYFLALFNLIIFFFFFLNFLKSFFKNYFLIFLILILISTYLFIIFGTIFLTGFNGPRYWSYLVPVIIIVNTFYIFNIKKKIVYKYIIIINLILSVLTYFIYIDKPQVRKPDTPGLINLINKSNVDIIVSDNYGLFEHYLKNAYKQFDYEIHSKDIVKKLKRNFFYICLDLSWYQIKGSYWDELYDCFPKDLKLANFKKTSSIRLNGIVVSEFTYIKNE